MRNSDHEMTALVIGCVAALAFGPMRVTAQATGRISGVAYDERRTPVEGVEVTLPATSVRGLSDSIGRFQLANIPPGEYALEGRRFGYAPATANITIRAGRTRAVEIVLSHLMVMLDTVAVTASCSPVARDGFECRRRSGRGIYMNTATIDSLDLGYAGVGDLFRGVKGFRAEVTSRGDRYPVATGGKCLETLVNGHRASAANPTPRYAKEVTGLEIYSSVREAPAELQREGSIMWCAFAVYWTTLKGRSGPEGKPDDKRVD